MSEYLSKQAVDVYRAADEILTLRAENHRLRAAAIKLHETINSFWQGDCDKADVVAAQSKLCDALSTTTEPTEAERVREGDGNDA